MGDTCVVMEDHRVEKAVIEPWKGSPSVPLCIREGRTGQFLDEAPTKEGNRKVALVYPLGRTVTAELPVAKLKF